MKFKFLNLYLRKVWTRDQITGKPFRYDVQAFDHANDSISKATWHWYQKSKPTRRNRYVALNCFKYAVVWLPDVIA